MKHVDPTEPRRARDDAERVNAKARRADKTAKAIEDIFREASSKGPVGPVKTNAAGYKAAAANPRRVK